MIRNSKKLSRGFSNESEAPEPLSGLSNLSDIMLVFACGLMVALIMNLKVDVSRLDEAVVRYKSDDVKKIEKSKGAGMDEVGTVYKDPKTGKTYIVDDENADKIEKEKKKKK